MATPIITSLDDTDLYKFSMAQAMMHQFANKYPVGTYLFKCRTDIDLTPFYKPLNEQLDMLCDLRFSKDSINYLKTKPWFKQDFIDFLSRFQLNRDSIDVLIRNGKLDIRTVEGPVWESTWFEIYVLEIMMELVTNQYPISKETMQEGRRRLYAKAERMWELSGTYDFTVTDMGGRRRYSKTWHREVLEFMSNRRYSKFFVGTSNVMFARELGIKSFGTMAHEYLQLGQAMTRIADSIAYQLQKWCDEYRGDLGIALTDVVGVRAFLESFDKYFAKLFDGVRHDSGDPFWWTELMLKHYRKLGIDPRTKTLVYSDSVNTDLLTRLVKQYAQEATVAFGMGTHFTFDFPETKSLQMVMKLIDVNGQPVAKIPDSSGKSMCEDSGYVDYVMSAFGRENFAPIEA